MYFPYSFWNSNNNGSSMVSYNNLFLWVDTYSIEPDNLGRGSQYVYKWKDYSPNHNDLTDINGGIAEPLCTDTLNGYPVVTFYNDGISVCNALSKYYGPTSGNYPITGQQWTTYSVAKKRLSDDTSNNYESLVYYLSDVSNYSSAGNSSFSTIPYLSMGIWDYYVNQTNPNYIISQVYNGGNSNIITGLYDTWGIIVTKFDGINGSGSVGLLINGQFQTTNFGIIGNANPSANGIVIGQGPCMCNSGAGVGSTSNYGLNGSIAEIIMYSGLSDFTINIGTGSSNPLDSDIISYFRSRYNL